MAQVLEIPKEFVAKMRSLMDESNKNAWQSIECKHEIGKEVIQYKSMHRAKSTELLQEIADAIGKDVNFKFLALCERFVRRFPDFELFKQKYSEEMLEPYSREPSFSYIVENFLYEKRTIELKPDEEITVEEGTHEEGHHYKRAVINLIPFDEKFKFEDRYTMGAKKYKILPSNYLRGCTYGLWNFYTDKLISEQELEQVKLELLGRKALEGKNPFDF